jgi:hypothetical protein
VTELFENAHRAWLMPRFFFLAGRNAGAVDGRSNLINNQWKGGDSELEN